MISSNSDEKQYLKDGPSKAYITEPYDPVDLQLAKWGEVEKDLQTENVMDRMAETSNAWDYVMDGPGGAYRDAVAPESHSNLQIMRVWGEISEEDTFGYH